MCDLDSGTLQTSMGPLRLLVFVFGQYLIGIVLSFFMINLNVVSRLDIVINQLQYSKTRRIPTWLRLLRGNCSVFGSNVLIMNSLSFFLYHSRFAFEISFL